MAEHRAILLLNLGQINNYFGDTFSVLTCVSQSHICFAQLLLDSPLLMTSLLGGIVPVSDTPRPNLFCDVGSSELVTLICYCYSCNNFIESGKR